MKLAAKLEALKAQNAVVEAAAVSAAAVSADATTTTPAFEELSGTEQAAGSLGVHPEAWKPIKFMNNKHFDTLIKANALDDTLARRIEAFRSVAATAQ